MFKRLLFVVFLLAFPTFADDYAMYFSYVGTATGAASSSAQKQIGTSVAYHKLAWNKSGTVSKCEVVVEQSATGTSGWTDLVTAQTCTSNGTSTIFGASANYVRITFSTPVTGTGSVTASYSGYINLPLTDPPLFASWTAKAFVYSNALKQAVTTAAPTDGQILIGKTGDVPVLGSVAGTTNQITSTPGAGTITLSTPQDIATTSTPQFARLGLGIAADATYLLNVVKSIPVDVAADIDAAYFAINRTDTTNANYVMTAVEGVARSRGADESITLRGGHFRTYTDNVGYPGATARSSFGVDASVRTAADNVAEQWTAFTGVRSYMAPYFTGGTVGNLNNFHAFWGYNESTTNAVTHGFFLSDAGTTGWTYGLSMLNATIGTAEIEMSSGETIDNKTNGMFNFTGALRYGTSASYSDRSAFSGTQQGISTFLTSDMSLSSVLRGVEGRVKSTGGDHASGGYLVGGRFHSLQDTGSTAYDQVWGSNSTTEVKVGTAVAVYGAVGDALIDTGTTIGQAYGTFGTLRVNGTVTFNGYPGSSGIFGAFGSSYLSTGVTLSTSQIDGAVGALLNMETGRRKANAAFAAILGNALSESSAGAGAAFKAYIFNTSAPFDYGLDLSLVGMGRTSYGVADVRLSHGDTISNPSSGTISIPGNVGIGTTAPAEKLHVYNGNSRIDYGHLRFISEATPGAPTSNAPTAGGSCTAGTHVFVTTFVTANGETQYGAASAAQTCGANATVPLSAIPTGTSDVTTGRNVCASKAGTTTPLYQVGASPTIADNSTTTYDFVTADGSLTVGCNATDSTTGGIWVDGTRVIKIDPVTGYVGIGTMLGYQPNTQFHVVGISTLWGPVYIPLSYDLSWWNGSAVRSAADGYLTFRKWGAASGFTMLQFGGTTASYPALKTSAVELESRLADDSGGAPIRASAYNTTTNCADGTATPADCGTAAAGAVIISATATAVVVNTTAVTATSRIMVTRDNSLGTELSVTCNTQSDLVLGTARVTAKTAATSFTIAIDVAPTTDPACYTYLIFN